MINKSITTLTVLWQFDNDHTQQPSTIGTDQQTESSKTKYEQIDGLVQDCSISIASALVILQSGIKLSKWHTAKEKKPQRHVK